MEYLRKIRKARGLTMKQLGQMVGVTESAIGQYETDKRNPSYEMLLKLGEALGCSVDYLLNGPRGLVLTKSEHPEVEITEIHDDDGNVVDVDINLNTMLTGDDERDTEMVFFLEDLYHRPETRMLFKLAHDATTEDVEAAVRIIKALRNQEP